MSFPSPAPTPEASNRLAGLFVAANVLPTLVYVLAARELGWTRPTCEALRLPLVFTPLVSALALTAWADGPEAAGRLAGRFLQGPRRAWTWFAAAAVFPLLALVTLALRAWLHGVPVEPRDDLEPVGVLGLSLFLFLFPGVTEELGWRGFLQPRLARRFGPLLAGVGVGLTWGLWHGFDVTTRPDSYLTESYPWFLVMAVGASLVLAWIGEHSGHCVPVAMLGHFGVNAVFGFFPMEATGSPEGLVWKIFALVTLGAGALVLAVDRGFGRSRRAPAA